MKQETIRIRLLYGILIPIFFVVSLLLPKIYNPSKQDFAAYWQAGHMVLAGQNVYDSPTWIAERELLRTALHSEPTFQYPLPFAVFVAPFGVLPIDVAYMIWVFLAQISILISILILLSFHLKRSAYLDMIAVTGIFLFRATYITIFSGQILFFMLLVNVLAIYLFRRNKWFWGGVLLAFLTFKPSLGLPVLLFTGVWLLFSKRWRGILGMVAGGLTLFFIGAVVNPHWALDYLSIGGYSFYKYYGIQATLWGVIGHIFKKDWSVWVSIGSTAIVLAVSMYFLWRHRFSDEPFYYYAIALPIALLTAPYSWAHDHLLLIIPIVFLLVLIGDLWGTWAGAVFLFGIAFLADGLVSVAYRAGNDIWSVLIPITVFTLVLFVAQKSYAQGKSSPILN